MWNICRHAPWMSCGRCLNADHSERTLSPSTKPFKIKTQASCWRWKDISGFSCLENADNPIYSHFSNNTPTVAYKTNPAAVLSRWSPLTLMCSKFGCILCKHALSEPGGCLFDFPARSNAFGCTENTRLEANWLLEERSVLPRHV